MKIIVITGAPNKGKTSVLHLVYEKLILAGNGLGTKIERLGADNQRDFFDIVVYKGKEIAIYTMGDYPKCVPEAIKKAKNAQCDMLICACNDAFTKVLVGNDAINDAIIEKFEKTLASSLFSVFEANLYDCYRILAIIERETQNGTS
jgi:hypothetical protein